MKKLTLAIVLASIASPVFAADYGPQRTKTGEVKVAQGKNYRLEGDIGYSLNQSKRSGEATSNKSNLSAHVLWQRQQGKWGQEVRAEAIGSNDDKSTDSIEQYYLAGKALHRSSPTVYQYGQLAAEKDLNSAFDYEATATVGLGKDIIKTQRQSLTAEVGAGYKHSKERYTTEKHNEAVGTVAAFYEYQVNPTVRFNQDLGYEFSKESRTLRSRTALSADLTNKIAAVASYSFKDVDVRKAGDDSRNSLLSLGVRYKH